MTVIGARRGRYKVSDGSDLYEVDLLKKRCDCGADRSSPCNHMEVVQGLLARDTTFVYLAMSALHKEIRRSCLSKALLWVPWLVQARGESKVKAYLKNITFEETRNLDLWRAYGKSTRGLSALRMTELLCKSFKRWELKECPDAELIACRGIRDCDAMPVLKDVRELVLPKRDELEFYNWWVMYQRIMTLHFFAKKDRYGNLDPKDQAEIARFTEAFLALLVPELEEHGLREEAKIASRGGYHDVQLALEALTGQKDPRANGSHSSEFVGEGEDFEYEVELPAQYVLDWHTAEGKIRMRRFDRRPSEPGKPLPAKLDLRWSGQALGFWWRFRAFQQYGMNRYRVAGWEDVLVSPAEWAWICEADFVSRIGRGKLAKRRTM